MLKNKRGVLIILELAITILLYGFAQFYLQDVSILGQGISKIYNTIIIIAIATPLFVYKKQKISLLFKIGNIVFICAAISSIAIFYYQFSFNKTINCIHNTKMEKEYIVIVPKNSNDSIIEDILTQNIGILENDNAENVINDFIKNKNTDGSNSTLSDISYKTYSDHFSLINDLDAGNLDCIIISKYNYDIYDYLDETNNLAKNTKILTRKTYPCETNKEYEKKEYKNRNENVISYYINIIDSPDSINTINIPKYNYLLFFNVVNHKVLVLKLPNDYVINDTTIYNLSIDGCENIKANLENWYDVKIDYYVSININGIKDYIDQIAPISYDGEILTANEAYNLLTDNSNKTDEEIINTQAEVITEALQKISKKEIILKKKSLTDILSKSIKTDAPRDEILRLYNKIINKDLEITTLLSADGNNDIMYCDSFPNIPLKVIKPVKNSDELIKEQLKTFSNIQK